MISTKVNDCKRLLRFSSENVSEAEDEVSELFYDDILKTSHINDFECEYLFNHCEFEDGSPVGVKI